MHSDIRRLSEMSLALRHTVPYMDPAASFNPHTTIGAFLIGVLVSYVLVGVVTAQTYIYYCWFPDDSSKLKALRASVSRLCDIIHGLCIGHGLYVYTICDYRHPDRIFGGPSPSIGTAILFCAIISTCGTQIAYVLYLAPLLMRSVQAFFGFRIYAFSRKLYIPILIWIMTFLRLLAGFGGLISGLRMASLVALHKQRLWLSEVAWSISAATDLTIAATLVFYLHQQRKKSGQEDPELLLIPRSPRTAVLVDKLILWTIETGVLTSLSSIVALTFIFLVFLTLGAQKTLHEMNEHEISLKFSLPAMTPTCIDEVNSRFPPSLPRRRG
ncbi:hypothetical protein DFH08DRAFT_901788 [Mycena albidolilacea]|uniref:DUF6534 domain-containing protein n=1 Tax=Mycena albidolilacea TaxID=1033008 RepID=A0AAD7EAB4_9AGAR|nr:hypothetical protein DFH08DRAFT_901788 [Mycena albidolilacea]